MPRGRGSVINLGYFPVTNDKKLIAKPVLEQLACESLPDWHQINTSIRLKHLRAGDSLFRPEEQHPYVYFVKYGIIKMVYETPDGKAWIKAFSEEGRFFASLTALERGGPTSFLACAVGDATVEQLPYAVLLNLADAHPAWQKVLRRAFEIYGLRKEAREKELLTLSPEERYLRFITDRLHLAERLTDKDIAAYIRVTPVALSRIKRRIG